MVGIDAPRPTAKGIQMQVEWNETDKGVCSRCAGLLDNKPAAWLRTFRTASGKTISVKYCEDHAAAARRLLPAA